MQENMQAPHLALLTGHAGASLTGHAGSSLDRHAESCAALPDDERWPPLQCTLFITGAALACWGVLIGLATLLLG